MPCYGVMRAYTLDLRGRIIAFVEDGGSKAEAARRFGVAPRTVYRYLDAHTAGTLAPKTSWGHWRKLDPEKVLRVLRRQPDATLAELAKGFDVQPMGVWHCLRRLKVTLKKSRALPRT